jgi:hypothetical protein
MELALVRSMPTIAKSVFTMFAVCEMIPQENKRGGAMNEIIGSKLGVTVLLAAMAWVPPISFFAARYLDLS